MLPAISSPDRDKRARKENAKMKKGVHDKRLLVALRMPPRRKKQKPSDEYNFQKDEVAQWLSQQPEIISYIAELVQRLGYIEFDPATHSWKGSDFS